MATGELTGRPLPEPSAAARPFWDAVAEHRLVIQHCADCDRWIHPPLPLCPGCGRSDPGWRPVSGDGVVGAFTVVHRPPLPVFTTPYVIALVELADTGVRLLSNVIDTDPSTVDIGLPVRTVFRDVDGRSLYFFAPTGDQAESLATAAQGNVTQTSHKHVTKQNPRFPNATRTLNSGEAEQ